MFASNPRKIFSDIGDLLGISNLSLMDDGTCQLMFDGQYIVSLVVVPSLRDLVITCPCSRAALFDSQVALRALRANFMVANLAGGSLALGPDDRLHMQIHMPIQALTAESVLEAIERLLNGVEKWQLQTSLPKAQFESPQQLAILAHRE